MLPAHEKTGHWAGEQVVLSKQGRHIPTLQDVFLLRDGEGSPIRRCAIVTDITERKRAEEALRQSHDELQAIYDETVDGIIVVDAATSNPVRVNAAYCEMLGYSEEELKKLSSSLVHSPEVLPRVWQHIEAARKDGVARISDLPFLRKDGTTIYTDAVTRPISYNQRPGWISFFHDVSEHKAAQEALRQNHDELRAIYDGMVEGLAIIDTETKRIVRVNSSLCRMLGYTEEELLSMSIMAIHPTDDAADTLQRIEARAGGRLEEHKRPDAAERWQCLFCRHFG